jgi:hypothetical protein
MHFSGEIQYDAPDGSGVHSDIGWNSSGDNDTPVTDEHRAFLHQCLDEWLNKSNSTGAFWIGDPAYFVGWGG